MKLVHTWIAAMALSFVAVLSLGACGKNNAGGSVDAGSDGSTGNDAGSGTGGVWTPPTTVAACAAPTLVNAATLPGAPNRLLVPKLAWGGAEAGLAYVQTTTSGPWKVKLQRLSGSGTLIGSAVDVGTFVMPASPTAGYPTVAVATDGASYVVCYGAPADPGWSGFDCARVPVGSGGATSAAHIPAAGYPALAFGPGGYMLAYRDNPGFEAQPLDANGTPTGAPQLIRPSAAAGPQLVEITPTSTGYAVATAIASEPPLLDRLSPTGQVTGSAVSVGVRGRGTIASAGDLVGVAWVVTSNSQATAAVCGPNGSVTSPATLSASSQSYGQMAVAGAGGKFGVTWSDFSGFIGYRALAADGTAEGTPVTAHSVSWDDNPHALVAVADGFLLATTMSSGMNSLDIVHLGCP